MTRRRLFPETELAQKYFHRQRRGEALAPPPGAEPASGRFASRLRVMPRPSFIRQQLIRAEYDAAVARGEFHPPDEMTENAGFDEYDDLQLNELAPYFDFDYYLAEYPDIRNAGAEPLLHYFKHGWKEGRNPAPWFDTDFYLNFNPDIAAAGVNPFWHYIVAGKDEGRAPRKETTAKRAVLESLKPIEIRTDDYPVPAHERLSGWSLEALLRTALIGADGLVVAASHDCYPTTTGGVQIFVADEQSRFNARGFVYMHLSPLRAALHVKDDAAETTSTRIVIDGRIVGVASDAEIAEALENLPASPPDDRAFVVHSPLGHSVHGLARIRSALRPKRSFFWLHDYVSVCAGFQLLRNDVEFCGAPEAQSEGCHICIYGTARQANEQRLRFLFDQCGFTVVSPSEAAREIWLKRSSLPHEGVLVAEHARLVETTDRLDTGAPPQVGTQARPVRVAYIGYPLLHKGWFTFERILDELGQFANYRFFHFGSAGSLAARKNLHRVECTVSAQDRDLMSERLREHEIDLVVIAAEWPETFSYVAFEALAAGCDVLTLSRSGNVAAVVNRLRRGLVFEAEDEIVEFFASGKAVAYARARAKFGAYAGELVHDGTTAALI
jgi:glycosyltransferase involved in cell wall biosynthesis